MHDLDQQVPQIITLDIGDIFSISFLIFDL